MDTGKLVDDMNKIYSLIYGERWNSLSPNKQFLTRERPHVNYRHIVRYMVLRERGSTLKSIAEAEGVLFETEPADHTTIVNSVHVARTKLYKDAAYKKWFHQIGFFYDLRNGNDAFVNRLNELMQVPGFALAITLASLIKMNLVHKDLLEVTLNEYRLLNENFVKNLLQTKSASAASPAD